LKKSGNLDVLDKVQFEISYKDIAAAMLFKKKEFQNTEKLIKRN
jgi:two-component system phosphate regulon sensor histidine kinase PhoR